MASPAEGLNAPLLDSEAGSQRAEELPIPPREPRRATVLGETPPQLGQRGSFLRRSNTAPTTPSVAVGDFRHELVAQRLSYVISSREEGKRKRETERNQQSACDLERVILRSYGVVLKMKDVRLALSLNRDLLNWCNKTMKWWIRRSLVARLFWRRCERRLRFEEVCSVAIYFRVADPDCGVKVFTGGPESRFPAAMAPLEWYLLQESGFRYSQFGPQGGDQHGWREYKISDAGIDGSTIRLSETFPVTLDKESRKALDVPETASHFAWSYPVHEGELKGLRIPQLKELLENGGYLYFKDNKQHKAPVLGGWNASFLKDYYQLIGIKPCGAGGDGEQKPKLPFGIPHVLSLEDAYRHWGKTEEVTLEVLKDMGARRFAWIAPQQRLGSEHFPYGYPHGGFLYFGTREWLQHRDNVDLQREAAKEQIEVEKDWWAKHIDSMKESLKGTVDSMDRAHQDLIMEHKWFLDNHFPEPGDGVDDVAMALLMNTRYQLGIIATIGLVPSALFTYVSLKFALFAYCFMCLTLAAFVSVIMQLFFNIFGALNNHANTEPPLSSCLFFLALPLLLVLVNVVIVRVIDLMFEGLRQPYFVETRAKMLAVLSLLMGSDVAARTIDICMLLFLEVFSWMGFLYNGLVMLSGDRLPHLFFMGHEGYRTAVGSGFVSGTIYGIIWLVLSYMIVDVVYSIHERFAPIRDSRKSKFELFEQTITRHNILPFQLYWHRNAFKDPGETQRGNEPAAPTAPRAPSADPDDEEEKLQSSYIMDYNRRIDAEDEAKTPLYKWFVVATCVPWLLICWGLYVYIFHSSREMEGLMVPTMVFAMLCMWLATGVISAKIRREFPTLIGRVYGFFLTIFNLMLLGLFVGNMLQRDTSLGGNLDPLMTVLDFKCPRGSSCETLPRTFHTRSQAQIYPMCLLSWGEVTALDLAALSWIAYEPDCDKMQGLLKASFPEPVPVLETCKQYESMPRWIATRHKASNGGPPTIVVAVKGTSTIPDVYLDADMFSFIKVLQFLSFISPVLQIMPVNFVEWLLMTMKDTVGQSGRSERGLWQTLKTEVKEMMARDENATFVLTGHSLGGGMAEIVAAHLGLPALVWSAPGTLFSEMFFNVTEEELSRNVVVVIPDNDPVPRVDVPDAVVQRVQCFGKGKTIEKTLTCHKVVKSACEVWRVCGDPRQRDFTGQCAQFVDKSELGKLYPLNSRPILGTSGS